MSGLREREPYSCSPRDRCLCCRRGSARSPLECWHFAIERFTGRRRRCSPAGSLRVLRFSSRRVSRRSPARRGDPHPAPSIKLDRPGIAPVFRVPITDEWRAPRHRLVGWDGRANALKQRFRRRERHLSGRTSRSRASRVAAPRRAPESSGLSEFFGNCSRLNRSFLPAQSQAAQRRGVR